MFLSLFGLGLARPSSTSSNTPNHIEDDPVAFRILGLDRGQLVVASENDEVHAVERSSSSSEDDAAGFGFCHDGSMITQVGHVSVMQVCQAGEPSKKLVYSVSDGRVYARSPRFDDDVLEAVIYDHQKLFLRRSSEKRHVLVADVEGSGSRRASPEMHSYHVDVVTVDHVRDIESRGRVASWTIRVQRRRRRRSSS